MRKIKVFLTVVAMLAASVAYGQKLTVTGVVTDATSGEPVPFASVQVKGTMVGASSDADGKYRIDATSMGALIFASVGYQTTEIEINGKAVINVSLQPDANFIDDVIVVAYGTATKESFTGSASMVKSESIEQHVTASVTSALAGTTPGVQVISASGDPANSGNTIRIRGIGSMSASNAPLIILDGMPYDGSMRDINPNDVESMSVLKDAAASAIYGARGANGVILITTKKATASDAVIKFDARYGTNSRLIPQYDVITDPGQYYETQYKAMFNSKYYNGSTAAEAYAYADNNLYNKQNGGLGYQVYTVPAGEKLIGNNFKLNPNAKLGYSDGTYYYTPDNWYDEAFHNSFRQEYNLSVAGSGQKFNYYASFGYLNDGGIVDNSEYNRYTGRINAEYQAKSWFKLTSNIGFSHADSQTPSYSSSYGSSGNIFYICNMMAPIYPLYVRTPEYDANGNLTGGKIVYDSNGNPTYDSNQTGFSRANFVGNAVRDNLYNRDHTYSDDITAKIGAEITPFKGMTLSANLGVTDDNTRESYLSSVFGGSAGTDGYAYVGHSRFMSINSQYLAEYKTDFGGSDHNFDVLAGFEQYQYTSQSLSASNDHLFNPFIGELNNADGKKSQYTASSTSQYLTMGFLARAQYDYAGKYFVSGSYRRDASSRFAEGHRWGNFGSFGAAWLLSKEEFLSDVDWIDMLKLKASYGVTGNDNLGSLFPYSDQYTHSYNEETGEYSVSLSYKGNEDLTWESNHSINYGVDFELFGGKLNGTVEGFQRITSDLLYSKSVPLSSGNPTGYMPVNVGSISNTGFEVSLDGDIIRTKNFTWNWNANFSHYINKILALDESVAKNGIKGSYYIYTVGGSLYEAYMRKFAGVNPETGKGQWYYKSEVKDPDTGETVKDADGNVVYEDLITETFSKASQYDLGTVLPKLYGGFGTSVKAYGFDFSIQLQYQLGGRYYDGTYQALMHTSSGVGTAWHKDALNSWSAENPTSNIPRLDGDTSVGQTAVDNYLISSNYLSINNVTFGYTFPAKLVNKIALQALRVYVAGENLAVFSARQGVDPRYSMGLGSFTSDSGLNSGAYSAMRNITAGVTLTF